MIRQKYQDSTAISLFISFLLVDSSLLVGGSVSQCITIKDTYLTIKDTYLRKVLN